MQSARIFCHAIKSGSVSHCLPCPSLQFLLLFGAAGSTPKDSGDSNAPCDIILLTLIIHCARKLGCVFYQSASAAHFSMCAALSQFKRVVWASRTRCEARRSNKATKPVLDGALLSPVPRRGQRKAKAGNVRRSTHGPERSMPSMPSNYNIHIHERIR